MDCEWGQLDCDNQDIKCGLCIMNSLHYSAKKIKARQGLNKVSSKPQLSGRAGAASEAANHQRNQDLLSGATTRMTPNSGAGQVKGDEEIQGIINIMEEWKEQNKTRSRGNKSFSIDKEWLLKLKREALVANKEFWYLKGCFGADDDFLFAVVEQDIIMSMVLTMVEDRKTKYLAEAKIDVAERRARLLEVQKHELEAEIELLKAKIHLQDLLE